MRLPSAKPKVGNRRERSERKRSHSQRCIPPSPTTTPSNDNEPVPFNKEKRAQVVIGLNAVTRGLERDRLRAVVVCLSAKPAMMTQHLLMLVATRNCPAVALPDMSKTLSPLLGVTSALALGFKVGPLAT